MLNYPKLYKKIFGDREMAHYFPRNMEYLLDNVASKIDAKIVRSYFGDCPTYAKVSESLGISTSYVGMRLNRFYRICRSTKNQRLLESGIIKITVETIPNDFIAPVDFKFRKDEPLYINEALHLLLYNMLMRNNITTWGALKEISDEEIKKHYTKHNSAEKIIELRDRIEIID